MFQPIVNFFGDGGPFMVLLVLTSIVAVTFIIERAFALRWSRVVPPALRDAVEVSENDLSGLRTLCLTHPSPASRLLSMALQHLHWPREEITAALETRARREILRLERGLVVLEVAVGIAPLLGLVGTIGGLISLFGGLGTLGVVDNAKVAEGISIALNTTLMGLLIAIPALIAWSYFTKKVEALAVEMETLCEEFLRRQFRLQETNKGTVGVISKAGAA